MSFGFGSTTTAANTFGTTTPSTGFAFGGGDASKPLFGGSTENKPAFSFNNASTGTPSFGNTSFSFGAKTTASATPIFGTPTTQTGSAFGVNKPLAFGGFASPPNQTVGSPAFGQATANTQAAPQNLSFGATTTQSSMPFGTPATQTTTALSFGQPATTGFGFGKPAGGAFNFSTPTSGFSVPQPTTATTAAPQTSATTFNFLQSTTTTAPAMAFGTQGTTFSFGPTTTTANTGLGATPPTFGVALSNPGGFGAATATTTVPSSFGFEAKPAVVSSTMPAFGVTAAPQQTAAIPQATAFNLNVTTPGPTLGFGTVTTTTGLPFGGTATTSSGAISFGTTTSAPTFASPLGTSTSAFSAPAANLSFNALAMTTPSTVSTGLTFSTTTTTAGLHFGATTTSSGFGATTTSTGLGFGVKTTASSVPPFSSTAATTAGLGFTVTTAAPSTASTGLQLGKLTTSSAFTLAPTVTSQATAASLNFGVTTTSTGLGFGVKTTASSGPTFSSAATTAGLSFTATTVAPSTASTATSTTAGITPLAKSTIAKSSLITTTTATPPQPISSITFAQLEENINKWTLELEEQEAVFIKQATEVNAWDRLLIANGEKIFELNEAVQAVKNEQESLEHELDFVVGQQKELEDLLGPLEKQLLDDTGDRLRDPEREHMYQLAETLDSQLRQMSEDLKEVIEHLNETNRGQDSSDPIVQIGRILNAHMSSMQWVDSSIAQITTKLDQLKATHDTLRRDNERSFHLTYN